MAKIKLDKILEACETLVLKTNVAILEEAAISGLSDTEVAKSKLIIHENIRYIKNQLTQGGILESAQNMLADNWVEAIMEDLNFTDGYDTSNTNGINGNLSDIGDHIKKTFPSLYNGAEHAKTYANEAYDKGVTHLAKDQLAAKDAEYATKLAGKDAEFNNMRQSQQSLADVLNKPGAKIGVAADGIVQNAREYAAENPNTVSAGIGAVGALGVGTGVRNLVKRARR